jgi:hypothetical protein
MFSRTALALSRRESRDPATRQAQRAVRDRATVGIPYTEAASFQSAATAWRAL